LFTHIQCGSYAIANLQSDEVVALGDKKDEPCNDIGVSSGTLQPAGHGLRAISAAGS
jgi:hypothetical protein